jgi:1-acyl-sn-glycerol-3-phosphate acyltransferase
MDIPYVAMAIGVGKNYKIIAKDELLKVPILGEAIAVGENITIDRGSRKSQVKTYKEGLRWLREGVSLCTFPEGTRSR